MSIITLNTRSLPDSAVTTAKIAADAITDAKIADDVVGTEHLTAGEVDATALASNAVTTAKIADSAVTAAKTSGVTSDMFRNIIINGDMNVSQRGSSTSSITSNTYSLDRFLLSFSGSIGTWTVAQDTTVPTGQGFAKSTKIDCTTADASPSSGDRIFYTQRIEGQNLQYLKKGTSSAESLTLSFWVRSNKTGTYIINLYDGDNSRQISKSYTISSADTWEKKELTFAGDTTGAFGNDNAVSLYCNFYLGAGTDYTSGTLATSWESATNANAAVGQVNLADSTSNEWYVTGVQLEAGTSASDFEFLPYEINMDRCRRYYMAFGYTPDDRDYFKQSVVGTYYSTGGFYPCWQFPTVMRAAPTFATSAANAIEVYSGGTSRTSVSVGSNTVSRTHISLSVSTSNATAGHGGLADFRSSVPGFITLNAEL